MRYNNYQSIRDDMITRQGNGNFKSLVSSFAGSMRGSTSVHTRKWPRSRNVDAGATLGLLIIFGLVAGCAQNLANVRTLAASLQTATSDTETIVAADNASCQQNLALQQEYKLLVDPTFRLPSCSDRAAVLGSILAENKAMQAYGSALGKLADDQFATTDTDAKAVTTTLTSLKAVGAPVVAAVGSVFALIESAALNGYRQHELKKVMIGPPADAFKTIMTSYTALADQYSGSLQHELDNLALIQNAIKVKHGDKEAVAVAELGYRFAVIQNDITQKQAALDDYSKAIAKVEPAFDAAVKDLKNPNPKEIYDAVKSFAAQVKDAHDKLKKAFG
jgi:hypothetical protein